MNRKKVYNDGVREDEYREVRCKIFWILKDADGRLSRLKNFILILI